MINHFSKALPLFAPPKFSLKFSTPFTLKDVRDIFLYRSTGKIKRYLNDASETEDFILRAAIKQIIKNK